MFDEYNIVYFDLTLIILKNVNLNITFNVSRQIQDYKYNFLIELNVENYGKINFIHCDDNNILFDLNIYITNYGIVNIGDYIVFYPYYNTNNFNTISCYYFFITYDIYNYGILKLKKTNKYIDDNIDYMIFFANDNTFINGYKIELETPDIKIFLIDDIFMLDLFYKTPNIQNKNDQNYLFLNLPPEKSMFLFNKENNIDNETKEKYEEEIKKLKLKNQLLLLLLAETYNQQPKIQNNDLLKLMYNV